MIVIYENDNQYDLYSTTDKKVIKKHRFFEWFEDALLYAKKKKSKVHVLLDESKFHYYTFRIECTSRDPFTITDFKTFLKEKLKQISRGDWVSCEYCKHTVENCMVNWKPEPHYIWKTGDIWFDLHIIVLKTSVSRSIKHSYWSTYLTDWLCTILPRTFYLVNHLKKALRKNDFSLLMIYNNSCTLLWVQRWFYNRYETVNMGEKLLHACYKEHDIDKYLYEWYDKIEQNAVLQRLVWESLLFYSQQLCTRLQQYLMPWYELLLMSNMLHNPLFISTLQQHYHATSNWFIVPLNTLFRSVWYTYNYTPNEIPVVACFVMGG